MISSFDLYWLLTNWAPEKHRELLMDGDTFEALLEQLAEMSVGDLIELRVQES